MKHEKTGGVRLAQMIEDGKIDRGGLFIDTYNQTTRQRDRIVITGQVWESRQNGMVYDVRGLSPTITVGNHSGVEPKISMVYESD